MNIQEIYELGIAQGWDEDDAYYLATIAWAESKGDAYSITDEWDGTQSFGIWQINSIHLPKLVEAGILHQPDSGGTAEDNLALLIGQLADPVTNAKAADYVGHRRDYSEPWEDWDWTRWSVHGLPLTHANHPSKYSEDVTRDIAVDVDALNAEIPDDFRSTITGTKEWKDRIEEWGLDQTAQDAALRYIFDEYTARGDTLASFLDESKDVEALNSIGDLFTKLAAENPSYVPSTMEGHLPRGWMKFWGEDTPEVATWFEEWEQRFEENRNREVGKFAWDDMEDDFIADLQTQGWWTQHTQEYLDLTQLWYTGGGPGGEMREGELFLGEGDPIVPEWGVTQSLLGLNYLGSGDWRATWEANKLVARSTLFDFDKRLDDAWANANPEHLNNIAFMLMREGGASNFYLANSTWADAAASKIERYAADNIFTQGVNPSLKIIGMEGLGAGRVQDVVDRLRNRANGQLWNIDDATLKDWAIQITTEEGPNEAQRMAEIDAHAYGSWGLTSEEQEGMGEWAAQGSPGTTISDLVNPAWEGAVTLWDDDSYRKDDPWLMDHYQVVNDDGSKRFRTRQEMRDVARTNLDRFQHSKEYQDPLNQFLTRAAAMFRSDY